MNQVEYLLGKIAEECCEIGQRQYMEYSEQCGTLTKWDSSKEFQPASEPRPATQEPARGQ